MKRRWDCVRGFKEKALVWRAKSVDIWTGEFQVNRIKVVWNNEFELILAINMLQALII